MAIVAGEMNVGVYEEGAGRYRWRIWSGLRLIAVSGDLFRDRLDAELAALCFRGDAHDAAYDVLAIGDSWYWEARDAGGHRVAMASRRFDSAFHAKHTAAYVRDHAAQATFA